MAFFNSGGEERRDDYVLSGCPNRARHGIAERFFVLFASICSEY